MVHLRVDETIFQPKEQALDIELQRVTVRVMGHRLFETFYEMVDSLPPKAVMKAVAIERFMLEEDLAQGRIVPSDETTSILTFCRFLGESSHGWLALSRNIRTGHWTFYRRTVERLIAAGELPHEVRDDFEAANRGAISRIVPDRKSSFDF